MSNKSDTTIFCFSGTGNSLYAATFLAKKLKNTEVISIPKAGEGYRCSSKKIGFVFPTYIWGMPNMVYNFIKSGIFNKDAYFFAVITCGMSIGKTATEIDKLLKEKTAHLSYGTKLRMVKNYIILYEPNMKNKENVLELAEEKLGKISADLKENKEIALPKGFKLSNWFHYKTVGKYSELDNNFNVSDKCTSCGVCEKICPASNIVIKEVKPEFQNKCEQCLACVHWCPEKAINYKNKTQKRSRYHHPEIEKSQLP